MPTAASAAVVTPTPAATGTAAPEILVWEDDPQSEGAVPIAVPVPDDPQSRFRLNILDPAPPPGKYGVATPEFRYWTARAALLRCRDFWEPIMPADAGWQTGRELPVSLNAGVQLNAFYRPAVGLAFYRDIEDGAEVFVGESADIACHELGHAFLDAFQPRLWGAQAFETAALHEAFGDISALLSGLQVPSLCQHVLQRHGGWIERDSRWTRVGEALGKAINRRDPDRGSPICLRNAANSFYYRPPAMLPASGPDAQLTREPHSLARTFIAAFTESLGGMARAQTATVTIESLQETSLKAAVWLVVAIRAAPVQNDYFFQVASQFVQQAVLAHDQQSRDVIASAFVRRGILPIEALNDPWPLQPPSLDRSASGPIMPQSPASPMSGFGAAAFMPSPADSVSLQLDARRFGLKAGVLHLRSEPLTRRLPSTREFVAGVHRSMESAFAAATASPMALLLEEPVLAETPAAPVLQHEEEFIHYLFQRGRVEFAPETLMLASTGPMYARKTHRLQIDHAGQLTLERISFDCGFD